MFATIPSLLTKMALATEQGVKVSEVGTVLPLRVHASSKLPHHRGGNDFLLADIF